MLSPAFGSAEHLTDALREKSSLLSEGRHQQDDSTKKISDSMVVGKDASAKTKHGTTADGQSDAPPLLLHASDEDLISRAEEHHTDDRLLAAARLLRAVEDPTLLGPRHRSILRTAADCEAFVSSLKSSVDDEGTEWTKQGESHGRHDTVIYYKMGGKGGKKNGTLDNLTARVETPVPPSLLVPLLSVLNESELYRTWLPSWDRPRLGVTRSDKLSQEGRVSQTILVAADVPWPLSTREVVICATAFDDIDSSGDIAVRLKSPRCVGKNANGDDGDGSRAAPDDGPSIPIPPPEDGAVRVDFEGGFLFRRCPPDHPALRGRRGAGRNDEAGRGGDDSDPGGGKEEEEEDLILASFSMFVDAKIGFLPQSVVNFVVRTVIGRMWEMFLSVAEGVREGRRPPHGEAIAAKRECLYDWVDERVEAMLGRMVRPDSMGAKEEDAVVNSAAYLSYIQC